MLLLLAGGPRRDDVIPCIPLMDRIDFINVCFIMIGVSVCPLLLLLFIASWTFGEKEKKKGPCDALLRVLLNK